MSKKSLATAMGFDASYISHIESGRMAASEDFARKADAALTAAGALWQTWRLSAPARRVHPATQVAAGLVVEDDHAELRYDGTFFRASQRRLLRNDGPEPVTRYLMRISVDRYPGQPECSNALYRSRPLRWEELGLTATCDREPMAWRPKADRDSFKEAWLCARPDDGHEARPELRTASDRMKAAGIIQAGHPVLSIEAAPFDLPAEAADAREVTDRLFAALQRVREHHVFGKGMGIAAPQIGISRTAAIVIPPDADAEPLVLLNPRVISQSSQSDEQYEGCLSFFDVRGMVPRPLQIEVACTSLDGQQHVLSLDTALARLAAHEIDHLSGLLYTARMHDGTHPIPVAEYRGTGHAWTYADPR